MQTYLSCFMYQEMAGKQEYMSKMQEWESVDKISKTILFLDPKWVSGSS